MRRNRRRERVQRTGQILQVTLTNRVDGVEIFSKVLDFVRFCQVIVDNFSTPIHQRSPRCFSCALRKLVGSVDISSQPDDREAEIGSLK